MGIEERNSPSPPPLPLSYQPPEREAHAVLAWVTQYVLWGVFGGVAWAILGFIPSRFTSFFGDFKVELPGMTQALLGVSRGLHTIWGVGSLATLCLIMPVVIYALNGNRLEGEDILLSLRTTRRIVWLLYALMTAFAMLALFLPMMHLIDAVSGHK